MPPTTHLAKADPLLAELIATVELPPIEPSHGVFYDLVSCLVDQQVPQRSRHGVYLKKVKALLDGEAPDPYNVLRIEEADWNQNKLANPKYHRLRALAEHWIAEGWEDLDWHTLPDATVREQLSALPGIGAQSIDMILLYTLERPDIFPPGDYHVKQAMTIFYDLEPKPPKAFTAKTLAQSAAWAPHRSLATRYLLAGKQQLGKK